MADKTYDVKQETYTIRDKQWKVLTLIDAAQKLEPFEAPINLLDRSYYPFHIHTMEEYVDHWKRVRDADLDCPIIISKCGVLMDGRHRLAKAIIQGRKTIKAVQFETMPPNDYTV